MSIHFILSSLSSSLATESIWGLNWDVLFIGNASLQSLQSSFFFISIHSSSLSLLELTWNVILKLFGIWWLIHKKHLPLFSQRTLFPLLWCMILYSNQCVYRARFVKRDDCIISYVSWEKKVLYQETSSLWQEVSCTEGIIMKNKNDVGKRDDEDKLPRTGRLELIYL